MASFTSDRTQAPRVTVFIPVYNTRAYIAEAIDSVLAQSYRDFELLVIDDASTDGTAELLAGYASREPRIRVVTHAYNRGRPATRNHGLELATGELIAFLDADDICVPQRLAQQVAYLDAHPRIDGVGAAMAWIDANGSALEREVYDRPLAYEDIACCMLVECPLSQPTLTIRRRALAGYRYDPAFAVAQDYELWARMIATCRFANLAQVLVYYRQHSGQATVVHAAAQRSADLSIYGRQVAALGMEHDSDDLVRHECLFRLEGRQPVLARTGRPLDIDYLKWARNWLEALRAGNARYEVYPEPAFSNMLAARWLFACRKAARNSGYWKVAREFLASPLRRVVYSHLRQRIGTRLRGARAKRPRHDRAR